MDGGTEKHMNLTPMDVYTAYEIDFNMAAYCRGHKYSPEAVELARALRAKKAAEMSVRMAEQEVERCKARLNDAVSKMKMKMERDPS